LDGLEERCYVGLKPVDELLGIIATVGGSCDWFGAGGCTHVGASGDEGR
jgi:hypothetical protein